MIQLRASKGLGDAIYMRAIALHLRDRGESVEVFTAWPDVFSDLGVPVRALAHASGEEDWRYAKPCLHCRIVSGMDAFSMACLQAGVDGPVALRIGWSVRNVALADKVRSAAGGRPVLVYQPPKLARNLNETLSRPRAEAYREALASVARGHFVIRLGHPSYTEATRLACDLDLFGSVSVTDAIDVCAIADHIFCEPSYMLAAAEALEKPYTCVFSRRAVDSGRTYISNLTPTRLCHKPRLMTAIFDEEAACAS